MSKDRALKDRQLKEKLSATINALEKSGRYQDAIRECKKFLELNIISPKDKKEKKEKLIDLYEKAGDYAQMTKEAFAYANELSNQGFHPKAMGLLKRVYDIDRNNVEVARTLAEIYRKRGFNADAFKIYSELLGVFYKSKDDPHSIANIIETLRTMCDIDPSNINVRIKLIEYLIFKNYIDEAKEEVNKLLSLISVQKDVSLLLPVYEKCLIQIFTNKLQDISIRQAIILKHFTQYIDIFRVEGIKMILRFLR